MIKQIVFVLLCFCFVLACTNAPKEVSKAVPVGADALAKLDEAALAEADSIEAAALALAEKEAEETAKKEAEEKAQAEAAAKKKAEAKKKAVAKKKKAVPKPKKTSKKPKVVWERKVHNFGLIEQGESVTRKFYFINEGTAPLVIKDATATCGCTRPGFPFIPIKPGEESYVSVTFNSKGKYGDQEPTVTVITNASPSTHILKMKGTINAELEVAQPTVPVSENGQ